MAAQQKIEIAAARVNGARMRWKPALSSLLTLLFLVPRFQT
jgi:hypothetical protein